MVVTQHDAVTTGDDVPCPEKCTKCTLAWDSCLVPLTGGLQEAAARQRAEEEAEEVRQGKAWDSLPVISWSEVARHSSREAAQQGGGAAQQQQGGWRWRVVGAGWARVRCHALP